MVVTVSVAMAVDGQRLAQDIALSAENFTRTEFTVADGQTVFRANLAMDISQLKAVILLSDKTVTLKSNSSGSPDDTLILTANVPLFWYAGMSVDASDLNLFDVDTTDFYVANASGAPATIKAWVAQDGTP